MYLISLKNHSDGIYSTVDNNGEYVVYFFRNEDDAERYLGLLEANDEKNVLPALTVNEVSESSGISTCEMRGIKYIVIEEEDIIIPPRVYDNVENI